MITKPKEPKRKDETMEKKAAKPRATGAEASFSKVESWFLEQSGREALYRPAEKIPVIEVAHFPALGQLTAMRFLEWAAENPEGVISLPTGKTPEYFIKQVIRMLENWTAPEVRNLWAKAGVTVGAKPDLRGLHFVQIDEFYPIDPRQQNSFTYYVNKHYIRGFGLDPARAMLIDTTSIGLQPGESLDTIFPDGKVDLSLRSRNPASALEERQYRMILSVDQFCSEYEAKIRQLGGIGFFLGGIGPDGHIGFNARGSHLYSPTSLTLTNYETEAAAAGDLGGIEVSRRKPVITIGLGTITYNPKAVVIIFAAGDAKSRQVADAIRSEPNVLYPATVLQGLPQARFYLTKGATIRLVERQLADIVQAEKLDEETLERVVIDRALTLNKRLDGLQQVDAAGDVLLEAALRRTGRPLKELAGWVRERLLGRIERGLDDLQDQRILHTGPHHDDIMLGMMPYVMHLVRRASNTNAFYVLTSGFTAVTNNFLAELLKDLQSYIARGEFEAEHAAREFDASNNAARAADVYHFLDGIAARSEEQCRRAQARRTLFNLMQVYEDEDLENITQRIHENLNYLKTLYPGKKDVSTIQKLKGMQREYEEELIWAYVGTNPDHVHHGRLGFYTGDIFTEQPTLDRDVAPVLKLFKEFGPSIVTLAFDPEGAGPDTHYKVLQVLNEALLHYQRQTGNSPTVWGYRNVWHRFHPSEANIYIPATLNTMAIMEHSFMNCMGSQKNASFPSFEYDGPFCYLAQRLWVEQFEMLKTCLGERYFLESTNPRLRATRGLVFLKAMELDEFSGKARRLAQMTEAAGKKPAAGNGKEDAIKA